MIPSIDIDPVQSRLNTARHEAGHVLTFLLRGLPFKNVEIHPAEMVEPKSLRSKIPKLSITG